MRQQWIFMIPKQFHAVLNSLYPSPTLSSRILQNVLPYKEKILLARIICTPICVTLPNDVCHTTETYTDMCHTTENAENLHFNFYQVN